MYIHAHLSHASVLSGLCALVVGSLCTDGLLSFLWTISMHYLCWSLVPTFILVLVMAIYWIHVLINNPLLNLCIRVSCNRMGKRNREGKATTTAREKTRVKICEKENLSVGRQAGRQQGSLGSVVQSLYVCVCRCGVSIYLLKLTMSKERGRQRWFV